MLETHLANENAYDTALWIIGNETNEELIGLAKEMLIEYEKNEELIGDDDNPFNPYVHNLCELEEKFLTKVKLIIC